MTRSACAIRPARPTASITTSTPGRSRALQKASSPNPRPPAAPAPGCVRVRDTEVTLHHGCEVAQRAVEQEHIVGRGTFLGAVHGARARRSGQGVVHVARPDRPRPPRAPGRTSVASIRVQVEQPVATRGDLGAVAVEEAIPHRLRHARPRRRWWRFPPMHTRSVWHRPPSPRTIRSPGPPGRGPARIAPRGRPGAPAPTPSPSPRRRARPSPVRNQPEVGIDAVAQRAASPRPIASRPPERIDHRLHRALAAVGHGTDLDHVIGADPGPPEATASHDLHERSTFP